MSEAHRHSCCPILPDTYIPFVLGLASYIFAKRDFTCMLIVVHNVLGLSLSTSPLCSFRALGVKMTFDHSLVTATQAL